MIGEILSKKVGQHAGVKFLASLHTKTIFYNLGSRSNLKQNSSQNQLTTLQSMMNAKLSHQRFWYCYENGLIQTIQTIPHNLYVSFKSASLYCDLRGLSWLHHNQQ